MGDKLQSSYSVAAERYDAYRGMSTLLPVLIRGSIRKNFRELSILDIGSGTGAAAEMLLKEGVGKMTLMDPSRDMMNVAEEKLKEFAAENRVFTKLDGLPKLDFEDCEFDAVMIMGTIHLVDDHEWYKRDPEIRPKIEETQQYYPKIYESLQEVMRVLKPGGIAIIVHTTPKQRRFAVWYSDFFPNEDVANNFPGSLDKHRMENLLTAAGFTGIQHLVDLNCPFNKYNTTMEDTMGIENEEWRIADSRFLHLTENELESMLTRVREAKESGELDSIVERTREHLATIGDTTFFIGRKQS